MCGISIILSKSEISSTFLEEMTTIVSHRGPDDEVYLLLSKDGKIENFPGMRQVNLVPRVMAKAKTKFQKKITE